MGLVMWNYRVCKKRFEKFDPKVHDPEDEFSFTMHEVYYNKDESIRFTSVDPIAAHGVTVEEMKDDFYLMLGAFDKPVIDLDNIVYQEPDDEEDENDYQELDD